MERGRLDEIMARYADRRNPIIEVMQDIQREEGYLPEGDMAYVGEKLELSPAEIYHLATFYKAFNLTPRGKRLVRVCMGTACYVRGAPLLVDELDRGLGLRPGQTSDDGEYTFETVNCVGACAMAPCAIIDGESFGAVRPNEVVNLATKGTRDGR